MPEGDSLHRAAERVGRLAGQVVRVETPHPRAAALGLEALLDRKRLERVEAVGKNLLLTFEGDLVLRSHLRMRGRWQVIPAGGRRRGTPWLVIGGAGFEAVLWHGPVLELGRRGLERLGPDIMARPLDLDGMVGRIRTVDQGRELGEALLDQRLVSGIGNKWRAEALWLASVSPWARLREVRDRELVCVLSKAARAMHGPPGPLAVYRRAGRPCRRCRATIRSRAQGDDARIAYWCHDCQRGGTGPATA